MNDPARRLTWHQGTVLPYASLWHTALRVAALNFLRAKEMPDGNADWTPGTACLRSGYSLLFNETGGVKGENISLVALARALGEPVSAFHWSHLGGLPQCLRDVVHGYFRICPQCLAAGYHTALFSVTLLDVCPIHGCELWHECRCGRPFEGRIDAKALAHVRHCECGKLAFFTRETCRRPKLTAEETRPLQPVIDWLERLVLVGVPVFGSQVQEDARFGRDSWASGIRDWCDALQLGYPSCFTELQRRTYLRVVMATTKPGVQPTAAAARLAKLDRPKEYEERADGRYWDVNPATSAYRGMLRHLRRHVARGTDRFAMNFLENPDPLRIASVMRSNAVARVAFAEMVWCERMEFHVMRRRWPYRRVRQEAGGDYVCSIETPYLGGAHDPHRWWHDQTWEWAQYQACRALMLSHWREAQRLACDAIRRGIADWQRTPAEDAYRWATVNDADGIRFVCLEAQSGQDWTLPLPDKARRRRKSEAELACRLRAIQESCEGSCLTWNTAEGWQVKPSARPAQPPVDGHKLLGAGRDRPKFWLFETDGRFAARARDVKLQVFADTPRDAIEVFRLAMRQYRRLYPLKVAQPAVALEARPKPIRDDARKLYETYIASLLYSWGFWRGARIFVSTAENFLAGSYDKRPS